MTKSNHNHNQSNDSQESHISSSVFRGQQSTDDSGINVDEDIPDNNHHKRSQQKPILRQTPSTTSQTNNSITFSPKRVGTGGEHQHHHQRSSNYQIPPSIEYKTSTIKQHYYPEGAWGWVVVLCVMIFYIITFGLQLSYAVFHYYLLRQPFGNGKHMFGVIIGCLSTSVTLFLSPVVISVCRRKSVRLIAILGGLITALGCLFASFATQMHQIFISYGIIVGVGVSMIRETAVIMIGQYFKKRREFVEVFVISSSGIGIAFMPQAVTYFISSKNWRFGFQAMALISLISFILSVLYRPVSLYHPQRRAILHLKNLQKRSRIKAKKDLKQKEVIQKQCSSSSSHLGTSLDKPPYLDFSVLKSRTVQILICGTCISSIGTTAPLLLLMPQQGLNDSNNNNNNNNNIVHTYNSLILYLGIGMILGTIANGILIVNNSVKCMIARQYLCQGSCFMMSAILVIFAAVLDGDNKFGDYVLFVWTYGFFYGGYRYSLKMFIYQKVKARNFNTAWSCIQFCQSIPTAIGVPITAILNNQFGDRSGYYLSSLCIALGSLLLFLIDAHQKRVANNKRKIGSVCSTDMGTDTLDSID
ncbi:monocarboxylate transporter 2-like [Oppia nitens]|uniref:monocarboxylate transporter 2-like n=1 Tax=Oppia nitens TaxID=1686743 RepID=UPI0023D99B03|nr:monocarboxylate transporter 2-like [Oppia nitens]